MDDLELSANVFHEQAVQAYVSSRMLLATTSLFPVGLYSAHLACECMLKSLTAQSGSHPVQKHDLLMLNTNLQIAINDNDLLGQEYIRILTWLNPYSELGRYGALARPQNDPDRVISGPVQVRGAVSSQPSGDMKDIDFVFTLLRSISTVENDIISKIVAGKTVRGWNSSVSIEEVVLAHNKYTNLLNKSTGI